MSADDGKRVWVCDVCGVRETWGKGWSYVPGVASVANAAPGAASGPPWVMCSDACEEKGYETLDARWRAARDQGEAP